MPPKFSSASSGEEEPTTSPNSTAVLAHRLGPAVKVIRKRKSVKKVKTGCQTCKHVDFPLRTIAPCPHMYLANSGYCTEFDG